ncbi:MAG: hypothetical protein K6E63_02240 [Lachnospiraceae bacterium]|nr:hypothetical protein [Lachnospiraceae bacterium]
MSFLSLPFVILISVLLILLFFIKNGKAERLLLLIASYLFYACFDVHALALLFLLSLFTWAGAKLIAGLIKNGQKDSSKKLLIACIFVQVIVLAFFKYAGLFPMPVGLSFYMLQAISLLADTYRGDIKIPSGAEVPEDAPVVPSLLDSLVYIGFFPQVVSGPIVKARDFIPQLSARKKLTLERFSYGIQLFALGAFLKLVMADRLAVCVDKVYDAPLAYSGLTLLLTSVGYSLQLLFDFAGYSDMAIGVAWLLGFDLEKNFNLPYMSVNPSDFWHRWHISLSSWLKDYLYIPLGGSRKGNTRTYINIFLTMVISGLWHGSTVNFLIWGALHGLWQVIHRALTHLHPNNKTEQRTPLLRFRSVISMILSFLAVNFLWIPFRAQTLSDTWTIVSRIVTLKPGIGYYYVYIFIFGAILLIVQLITACKGDSGNPVKPLPLGRMYGKIAFCILIIATLMFAYFGSGAFIYSQF